MDDQALETIKRQLDTELEKADEHIGIAFGMELYAAFGKKGWLTREKFSASGTGAFPIDVVAYGKTHNAIACWDVSEWAYRIGKRDA